jgi:eukaryotic-like serine/threonine-protein kinase
VARAAELDFAGEEAMTLSTGAKLGPYEIVAPIGAGGMGEVYRARDTRLGREVAIKVLPASFASDAERLRRFEQEARAASALNHPNILAIYDIGTHEGAPFLVTELLEGETLRERLRNGPLPVRKALDIAIQTANGVAAAHEKGIIHRDLKPANIFLTNDGRAKILDFGLAKLTQQDNASSIGETQSPTRTSGGHAQTDARTEAGVVLGTAGYMAPEQVRGKPADARSDIFALGAILYEMLSGQRAFEKDSSADTMAAILKEEPAELSGEGKKIPPPVERVVRHCLEKSPAERFQSARDLAFHLGALSDPSNSGVTKLAPAEAQMISRGKRRAIFATIGTAGLVVAVIVAYFAGRGGGTNSLPTYKQITFSRGTIFEGRFAPDGQSVYYSAAWDGQPPQVYLTDPNSPESRPLGLANSSLFAVSASQLAVSTGCNHAFIAVCEGTLATVPVSGGAPREIADDVISADWFSDGSEMAAVREDNGKFQVEFPLGKVIYESQTWLGFLRVSPRGDAVAFAQYSTDSADIGRVIILDKNGKQLARSEEYVSVEGLAWEPSGDRVLFAGSKNGGWADSLHTFTLNGKDRTVLTLPCVLRVHDISKDGRILLSQDQWRSQMQYRGAKDAEERDLSWLDGTSVSDLSEDGRDVVFQEFMEAAGTAPIAYLRNANEASSVKLGIGLFPVLSPDGKWALIGGYNPLHLALLPTGIGQAHSLETYGLQQFEWQGWMPDGKSVYFAGNDGHNWRMYVQDLAGGAPRGITPSIDVNAAQVLSDLVSPDGKFVFARDLAGKAYMYPVAGGEPRAIAGILPGDIWANWVSDGKSIYVYDDKVTKLDLVRIDVPTGNRQLVRTMAPPDSAGLQGIESFRITPDGKSYAYSYNRALSTLYLVDGVK